MCSKDFFAGFISDFRESLFSEGLAIGGGGNFAFQNGFGLSIKTTKNTKITA